MSASRRQDGFTLIELLVSMTLTVIVFGATLTILDVYMRQSTAATERFDAQDAARLGVDRIVRQLRNVSSPLAAPKLLERATPYDMVFQTIGTPSGGSGGNVGGVERVRYCIPQDSAAGSASQEELISQTQTWSSATAANDPWSSDPTVTIACPDPTFAQQPNGVVVARAIVNRYQRTTSYPAFSFNNGLDSNSVAATDLSQISTIQINLRVNPTPKLTGATTQIQSSAYLRNKQHVPVATFNFYSTGLGSIILNAGGSYSPDGEQLSYSWACTSSNCPAGTSLNGATDGLVPWSPGTGIYTVQLTVTDETGLSTNYSQSVTVS
jgi:prepilin-type N-terminal cleavage/methylation domain-containing protein